MKEKVSLLRGKAHVKIGRKDGGRKEHKKENQ
jgi:hypothetical protein